MPGLTESAFFDDSVSLHFCAWENATRKAEIPIVKKLLLVLAAVVLAPCSLVSLVVLAAGDWRTSRPDRSRR